MIEWGIAAAVMGVVGLAVFLCACVYHRVLPPIAKIIEAVGFGGCTVIGARLVYGAFHPSELCYICDVNGNLVNQAGLHLKFGEHAWEVVAGGIAVVVASVYSLIWLCKIPSHSSHPH